MPAPRFRPEVAECDRPPSAAISSVPLGGKPAGWGFGSDQTQARRDSRGRLAGYNKLMGADETGMLARLKDHHRELVDSMNRQSFFC
jgi:hypothetical protein